MAAGIAWTAPCFAAYALSRLGDPPRVVDLVQEPGLDDDHVLAIFRRNGRLGALGKSNFTGLRYREPVYASVRELVMSYFEDYFNVNGVRTLRGYTAPIDLRRFDRLNWLWDDAGCDAIERSFKTARRYALITPQMAAELVPLDAREFAAGTLGSNAEGLFKPPTKLSPKWRHTGDALRCAARRSLVSLYPPQNGGER